jgi:hypothetical protein
LYNQTNIPQVQVEETIHFGQHASEDEYAKGVGDGEEGRGFGNI